MNLRRRHSDTDQEHIKTLARAQATLAEAEKLLRDYATLAKRLEALATDNGKAQR